MIVVPEEYLLASKEQLKIKSTFREVFTIGSRIGFELG